MIRMKIVVFVTLFLLMIVFMMQNIQPVVIRFLYFRQPVPLIGVISILVLVGFVLGYLAGVMGGNRKKKSKGN